MWLGRCLRAECGGVSTGGWPKRKLWRGFSGAIDETAPQSGKPPELAQFSREAALRVHVAQVCREPIAWRALRFNNSNSALA